MYNMTWKVKILVRYGKVTYRTVRFGTGQVVPVPYRTGTVQMRWIELQNQGLDSLESTVRYGTGTGTVPLWRYGTVPYSTPVRYRTVKLRSLLRYRYGTVLPYRTVPVIPKP
jgi:hypothetical protein